MSEGDLMEETGLTVPELTLAIERRALSLSQEDPLVLHEARRLFQQGMPKLLTYNTTFFAYSTDPQKSCRERSLSFFTKDTPENQFMSTLIEMLYDDPKFKSFLKQLERRQVPGIVIPRLEFDLSLQTQSSTADDFVQFMKGLQPKENSSQGEQR